MTYQTPETSRIGTGDGPGRPDVKRPVQLSIAAPETSVDDAPVVDELLDVLSRNYQFKARADNTRRAYDNDFRRFQTWCGDRGYDALPASPETVCHYLADHADSFAVASLHRWLIGIAQVHREGGYPSPVTANKVRDTMKGIKREAADEGREPRRAYPIMLHALKQLVEPIPLPAPDAKISLIDLRDRAMLTLAWVCALRGSEVGSIRVQDLRETPRGFVVTIRKSKTNQEGKPHHKALPHAQPGNEDVCPNLALRAWLAALPPVPKGANKNRPLFAEVDRHSNVYATGITSRSVNRIIKKRALAAGFLEDIVEHATCHGLRRGFASAAAAGKANEHKVLRHVGWKDARMYRHYVEEMEMFEEHAATSAGL